MFRPERAAVVFSITLVSSLGLSTALLAQDPRETVYFTGPNNAISKVTSFPSGTAQPVVVDQGANFKGLVVRDDGSSGLKVIVASSTQGGGIRIYGAADGALLGQVVGFPMAAGIAVDTGGSLYAVNEVSGGPDELILVPRNASCGTPAEQGTCNPGGYGDAITLDHQVDGATLLAGVQFVASASAQSALYQAGDVLVLVENPATLWRYKAADIEAKRADPGSPDPTPTSVLPTSSFGGAEPTGFAFAPTGEILVTTVQGRVLRFSPGGALLSPDFASLPGSGVKISVGLQGGISKAFVTVHQGGSVQRFTFRADGTGAPDGAVATNAPDGVGNASLTDAVFVAASATPVNVAPTSAQIITYEQVTVPGLARAQAFLLPESALEAGRTIPSDFRAAAGLPALTVPPYLHAFERNGVPTFLVMVVDSSAGIFQFTLQHHIQEHDFGFETSCTTPTQDPSPQEPRTFLGVDLDDPPIVEGLSFIDISSGCASNLGRGGGTSAILTGWDSRSVNDRNDPDNIAASKLSRLEAALLGTDPGVGGLAPFITNKSTKKALGNLLNKAMHAFGAGNNEDAIADLQSFVARIRSSPGSFRECLSGGGCRNAPGELVARTVSAIYMLCGAGSSCNQLLAPLP
jgi:hypothetical protein